MQMQGLCRVHPQVQVHVQEDSVPTADRSYRAGTSRGLRPRTRRRRAHEARKRARGEGSGAGVEPNRGWSREGAPSPNARRPGMHGARRAGAKRAVAPAPTGARPPEKCPRGCVLSRGHGAAAPRTRTQDMDPGRDRGHAAPRKAAGADPARGTRGHPLGRGPSRPSGRPAADQAALKVRTLGGFRLQALGPGGGYAGGPGLCLEPNARLPSSSAPHPAQGPHIRPRSAPTFKAAMTAVRTMGGKIDAGPQTTTLADADLGRRRGAVARRRRILSRPSRATRTRNTHSRSDMSRGP